MRKAIALALAAGALLLVAACQVPGTAAPVGPDLVVGAPMSLTGIDSKDGALVKQGYDLWARLVDQHGGITYGGQRHRVAIRYQDDQSRPSVAAAVAGQMVDQQGARALLGTFGAATTAAEARAANQAMVPMVATDGADGIYSGDNGYVFGVGAPADQGLRDVLRMAATFKPRPATVAVLSADDPYSMAVARAAAAYAPQVGMRVVFDQTYPSGSTDLTALAGQAKATQPDVVLDAGHLTESIALIIAARDIRFDSRILAASQGPSDPGFVQALGRDADGIYSGAQGGGGGDAGNPTSAAIAATYRQMTGGNAAPPATVAAAAAAGIALQTAIEHAGSADPGRVRDALRTLDVTTFYGRIKFDSRGQNTAMSTTTTQIQSGAPATVWPSAAATAPPRYPTPPWSTRTSAPPAGPAPKAPATGQI